MIALSKRHRICFFTLCFGAGDFEISEYEIMKELIYCMQGIEGKIIKYMSLEEGFHLNPCVTISPQNIFPFMQMNSTDFLIGESESTLYGASPYGARISAQ